MSSNHNFISFLDPTLQWLHHPSSWGVEDELGEAEGSGGSTTSADKTLTIRPSAKKDFWSKTFYTPVLIKNDASALLANVPLDTEATIGVDFEFTPISQFDQAGLLIFIDNEHWVKCGIEYCDGSAKLSVVVCNSYSDWSTQPWNAYGARIRVHKILQGDTVVVEAAQLGSDSFHFIRIAHLGVTNLATWSIGPYAACPIAQKGCVATFTSFSVGPKQGTAHSDLL